MARHERVVVRADAEVVYQKVVAISIHYTPATLPPTPVVAWEIGFAAVVCHSCQEVRVRNLLAILVIICVGLPWLHLYYVIFRRTRSMHVLSSKLFVRPLQIAPPRLSLLTASALLVFSRYFHSKRREVLLH